MPQYTTYFALTRVPVWTSWGASAFLSPPHPQIITSPQYVIVGPGGMFIIVGGWVLFSRWMEISLGAWTLQCSGYRALGRGSLVFTDGVLGFRNYLPETWATVFMQATGS